MSHALRAGYRHIDTAVIYGNEEAVGEGIRASGVAREEVFVTTKVWWENLAAKEVARSIEASLGRLGLADVDLLLVHWPNPAIPLGETLGALAAQKRRGLTRHIGVSNFPSAMLEHAVGLVEEPLVTNQVESHPRIDQGAVRTACRRHGLALTAYSPLGQASVLSDPVIRDIAAAHRRTPGQIVLRWHVQQPGTIAVPKSATPERIDENIQVFDFALSDEEMGAISALARPDGRLVNPSWAPRWDGAT